MPVCRYGGATCQVGPGAVGDAETVDQHERQCHGHYHKGHKCGKRPVVVSQEVSNFAGNVTEGAAFYHTLQTGRPTAQKRHRVNTSKQTWSEEQRKRNNW